MNDWVVAAMMFVAVGCEGDTTSTPTVVEDCDAVAPADCATTDGCVPIAGRPLQDDGAGGLCADYAIPTEDLGCMSDELGCGDAETVADDPEGTSYLFPSTCVPSDFTASSLGYANECSAG